MITSWRTTSSSRPSVRGNRPPIQAPQASTTSPAATGRPSNNGCSCSSVLPTPRRTTPPSSRNSATVAAPDGTATVSGTWRYHASLITYQGKQSQYWYVDWAPDDLAPNLTASTHLDAVPVAPRVTSELYRGLCRNAARYAKGLAPEPLLLPESGEPLGPRYHARVVRLVEIERRLSEDREPVELEAAWPS